MDDDRLESLAFHIRFELLSGQHCVQGLDLIERIICRRRLSIRLFSHLVGARIPLQMAMSCRCLGNKRILDVLDRIEPVVTTEYGRMNLQLAREMTERE